MTPNRQARAEIEQRRVNRVAIARRLLAKVNASTKTTERDAIRQVLIGVISKLVEAI